MNLKHLTLSGLIGVFLFFIMLAGLLSCEHQTGAQENSGALTGVLRGNGYLLMPPSGSLSECNIRKVEIWVNDGSPNN